MTVERSEQMFSESNIAKDDLGTWNCNGSQSELESTM